MFAPDTASSHASPSAEQEAMGTEVRHAKKREFCMELRLIMGFYFWLHYFFSGSGIHTEYLVSGHLTCLSVGWMRQRSADAPEGEAPDADSSKHRQSFPSRMLMLEPCRMAFACSYPSCPLSQLRSTDCTAVSHS